MSSEIGKNLKFTVFGESHGAAVGLCLCGLPSGIPVDAEYISSQMARRAPGRDSVSTARKESDTPEILSGVYEEVTTGAPLAVIIRNTDMRSGDYDQYKTTPRPSHADFPAMAAFGKQVDLRGSGHFSGRLTAPIVFAGAICRTELKRRGVTIGAHIYNVGEAFDTSFDMVNVSADLLDELSRSERAVISKDSWNDMQSVILGARESGNSVGGSIEVAAAGLPVGLGSPMFGGIENVLSAMLFGIPAVKAVEFGEGTKFAVMRGSEANDGYTIENGAVQTLTNHNGGILGGLSTGMPLIAKVTFKPTPSIALPQPTVDLDTMTDTTITIKGRHDPCIVPRAVAVVEAAVAIGLLDLMLDKDTPIIV